MRFQSIHFLRIAVFGIAAGALVFPTNVPAQEAPVISRDDLQTETTTPRANTHPADGERHGLPVETFAVVPGTRFLVSLESDLNTKEVHKNQQFRVRTLEPLEAGQGNYLPPEPVSDRPISRADAARP